MHPMGVRRFAGHFCDFWRLGRFRFRFRFSIFYQRERCQVSGVFAIKSGDFRRFLNMYLLIINIIIYILYFFENMHTHCKNT